MPAKTKIGKNLVGLLRDPSPSARTRSTSRGRASNKRSPSPSTGTTRGQSIKSTSPARKSFVRTEDEGPAAVLPVTEVFAPEFASVAAQDWGKLVAIVTLEVLFFMWLKWGSDIGLWSAMWKALF